MRRPLKPVAQSIRTLRSFPINLLRIILIVLLPFDEFRRNTTSRKSLAALHKLMLYVERVESNRIVTKADLLNPSRELEREIIPEKLSLPNVITKFVQHRSFWNFYSHCREKKLLLCVGAIFHHILLLYIFIYSIPLTVIVSLGEAIQGG